MVAIVTGEGLGLFNSSLSTLGGQGAQGSANQAVMGGGATSGSSNLYVNAATGNLVVQSLDEQLSGSGLDNQFLRTYNSLGLFNDSDGDNWRHNGERNLIIRGGLNQEGSSITRIAADGSQTEYRYNRQRNAYLSTDGASAHDSIRLTVIEGKQALQWQEGSTHIAEFYDLVSGRIIAQEDANGNAFEFTYTDDRLTQIEDIASSQRIHLQYDGSGRLEAIATSNDAGAAIRQVHYAYDEHDRLETVTVDLEPVDSDVSDNISIRTVYAYRDTTGHLIRDITRYEGDNNVAVNVAHIEYDSDGRVTLVEDQQGQTNFDYTQSDRTVVTNAEGDAWTYHYDSLGQLTQTQSALVNGTAQNTSFQYNANGDVVQIETGGNFVRYYYDANGNRVREVNSEGNFVSRVFSHDNLLLSETSYTQASSSSIPAVQNSVGDPLFTLPNDLGQSQTTTYVYSDKRELRFVISPEGRVTEYVYNDYGLRTRTIHYAELLDSNVPPYLADPLQDQRIDPNAAFSFTIPESAFLDFSGDSFSYSVSSADGGSLPAWLNFSQTTRTFSGVAPASGSFSIAVTATSGGESVSDIFRLTAAEPSDDISEISNFTMGENTVLGGSVPGASGNFVLISQPNGGTLEFNADGTFSFDPGTDFDDLDVGETREAQFNYAEVYANGSISLPAMVTITLTGTNDAPVAIAGSATGNEDASFANQVPAATDIDGSISSYELVQDVDTGVLTFNSDGTFTFNPGLEFQNLAEGESRVVEFSFLTRDNHGAASAPAIMQLVITGVNDAPVVGIAGTSPTAFADQPIVLSESEVTRNILDVDGDPLTVVNVSNATNGTVSLHAGEVTFTPNAGYVGQASFDYTVQDAAGTPVNGTFTLNVVQATWTGNEFNETYNDTTASDNLVMGGGHDTVTLTGGNDIVDTGLGNDTVHLDDYRTYENRIIQLQSGDDVITSDYNASGNLNVDAGSGNDSIEISARTNATAHLGEGDDEVSLRVFNVNEITDQENHWTGGEGDDTFNTLRGADNFYFGRGDGHDTINDYSEFYNTAGTDRIYFKEDIRPSHVDVYYEGSDIILGIINADGVGYSDSIRIVNALTEARNQIEEVIFSEGTVYTASDLIIAAGIIHGTPGEDSFNLASIDHFVYAFDGNDTITSTGGNDFIDAGDGNDTVVLDDYRLDPTRNIILGDGDDTITSDVNASGNVTIDAGLGNDSIETSGRMNATVDLGEGNDTVTIEFFGSEIEGTVNHWTGGLGDDSYTTWGGEDHFYYNLGDGHDTIDDYHHLTGSSATDTLHFGEGITLDHIQVRADGYDLVIDVVDVLNASNNGSIRLNEVIGDNSHAYRHTIESFSFADGSSYDLSGLIAAIPVTGTSEADTLELTLEYDQSLYAYDGNDTVNLLNGRDVDFTRTIDLGAGDDRLESELSVTGGNIIVDAGTGNDEVILSSSHSGEVNLGDGNDTGQMKLASSVYASLASQQSMSWTGGAGDDQFINSAAADSYFFYRGDGNDTIYDYDSGYNTIDRIVFGENIAPEHIEINADGSDIVITIHDPANPETSESITVQNAAGNDSFAIEELHFTDGTILNLVGTNASPIADDLNTSTEENTAISGAVSARDIDGTIVSYNLVSGPSEGNLTFNQDGSFTFDPGSGKIPGVYGPNTGTDFDDLSTGESRTVSFTYTATDSSGLTSEVATAYITVTGTNDMPYARIRGDWAVQRTPVLELTFDLKDAEDSVLVVNLIEDVTQGSLLLESDGHMVFDPLNDFDDLAIGESREVSFSYTVSDDDGATSAPARVVIRVTRESDHFFMTLAGGDVDIRGSALEDHFTGGAGHDRLNGLQGNDTLYGGAGNDAMVGHDGDDLLYGGIGDDFYSGTKGSDTMVDIEGNDTYYSYFPHGNDTIEDFGGHDRFQFWNTVALQNINLDVVGDDIVLTLTNPDDPTQVNQLTVINAAVDSNYAIEEIELLSDGRVIPLSQILDYNGNPLSFSGLEDVYVGQESADTFISSVQDDVYIAGYGGNDVLTGGAGADYIVGGEGNDELRGGAGDGDLLSGGLGDDIYHFELGDGNTIIENADANAATNNDTIRFGNGILPTQLTVTRSGDDLLIVETQNQHTITIRNQFGTNASPIDALEFANGDSIPLVSGDINFTSVSEEAVLEGNVPFDPEADIVQFNLVTDVAEGVLTLEPSGAFTFDPDFYFGNLAEGETRSAYFTYTTTDSLGVESEASIMSITVMGVNTAPKVIVRHGAFMIQQSPVLEMNLHFMDPDSQLGAFTLVNDVAEGNLQFDADGHLIFDPQSDFDDLNVGENREVSFSYTVSDEHGATVGPSRVLLRVNRQADNFFIEIAGGDGHILGDNSLNDIFTGGAGDDRLLGYGGDDQLYGLGGNDMLGGAGGNNTLVGGTGDDSYWFFGGNDTVYDEDGADLYSAGFGYGQHVIEDFDALGQDRDRIYFGFDLVTLNDIDVTTDGDNLVVRIIDPNGVAETTQLTFLNAATDSRYMIEDIEFADGSIFALDSLVDPDGNPISFSGVSEFNYGTNSVDSIYIFEDSNNYIGGFGGDDTLQGWSGDDFIVGGTGNDHLVGGDGADTYYYALGDGSDTIGNFNENLVGKTQDILRFAPGLSIFDIEIEQRNNDLVILIMPTGDEITIGNHFLEIDGQFGFELSAYEFSDGRRIDATAMRTMLLPISDGDDYIEGYGDGDIVEAMGGNDTIWGYGGNDHLYGGSGNDTIYGGEGDDRIGGNTDNDYLEGGAGADTYHYGLGDGSDTIFNYEEGVSGLTRADTLQFSEGIASTDIAVSRQFDNLILTVIPTGDTITISHHYFEYTNSGRDAALSMVSFSDGTHWTATDLDNMAAATQTPITLDLDADGLEYNQLVHFDIDSDGELEATTWAGLGDGLLALDRDGDGLITHGHEISFVSDLPGATTDLEGVVAFDSNGNNQIDAGDTAYSDFLVWQDYNLDGVSTANELTSLADLGISSISLTPTAQNIQPIAGVNLYNTASFTRNGMSHQVGDVGFQYQEFAVSPGNGLESFLTSWSQSPSRNMSDVQVSENVYDVFGNLERSIAYGNVDSDGVGIIDTSATVSEFVYSVHGELLQTISVRGSTETIVSDFSYDGAGRLLTSTDAAGTSTNVYDGDARQIRVTNQAGLVNTQTFDSRGKLMSMSNSDGSQTRTTEYFYDAAGRLRMTEDAEGGRSWIFYDSAGRISDTVDEAGSVVSFSYNADGQISNERRFATSIDSSTWFRDSSDWQNDASFNVDSIAPVSSSSLDRETRYYYDDAGRLVSTVEENGNSDRSNNIQFDGSSRVVSTDLNESRISRFFYDDDGLQVGTLNAEGYLSENIYDGVGRLIKTIRYETKITSSVEGMTEARNIADDGEELTTYFYYDAQGRQVAALNEQGYLSETIFEPQNNRSISRQYMTAITASVEGSSLDTVRSLAGSYQSTTTNFDDYGRVTTIESVDSTITRNEYDSSGRLVRVISADGTAEERHSRTRFNAFSEITGVVSGVGATLSDINSAIAQYGTAYFYNDIGQRIREEGPQGQDTFYYYDEANRLAYTLNAEGDATTTSFNAFGEAVDTRQYFNRWDFSSLGALSGGDASTIRANMEALESGGDITATNTYTRLGQLDRTTDAAGGYIDRSYNTYGDISSITKLVSRSDGFDGPTTLRTAYEYDKLGRQTVQRQDLPYGYVDVETVTEYDAFNRITSATDGKGNVTQTEYNNQGREIVVTDALLRSTTKRFDAFGRVVESIDAEDNLTTTTYDDIARLTTTEYADGSYNRAWHNAHGETSQVQDGNSYASSAGYTSYEYNEDGNLTLTRDALGNESRQYYDRSGRVSSTRDARGNLIYFAYDKANRLKQRNLGTVLTNYTYNGLGLQASKTEGYGDEAVTTEYEYDNVGRRTLETIDRTGLGLTTSYHYTRGGQIARIDKGSIGNEAQRTTVFEYDLFGRKKSEIVDPNGLHIETNFYYDNNGNQTRTIHTNGNITSYTWSEYDDANQLIRQANRKGQVTSYEYDDNGRLIHKREHYNTLTSAQVSDLMFLGSTTISINIPTPSNSNSDRRTMNVFDSMGRVAFTLTATDFSNWVVTENVYDLNGNITETRRFDQALSNTRVESLLNNGLTVELTETELEALGYRFSNWGHSTEVALDTRRTRFVFDELNRLRFTISAENEISENTYDEVGNVKTQTKYAVQLTINDFSESAVDDVVDTLRSNINNRQTEFVYDSHNRLLYEYSAESTVMGYANDAATSQTELTGRIRKQMHYDSLGRVIKRTEGVIIDSTGGINDSNARETEFKYDKAGRQTRTTLTGWYDHVTGQVHRDQEGNSDRFQRTTEVIYDDLGNAVRNEIRIGLNEYAYQFKVYDKANRLAFDVDALGYVTKYSYDKAGNNTNITRRANRVNTDAYQGDGEYLTTASSILGLGYSSNDDRTVVNSFNSIGQIIKSEVLYAFNNFNSSATSTSVTARSGASLSGEYSDRLTTEFQYNAFGEQTLKRLQRNNLNDETSWAEEYRYYDRIGRNTLTVDAERYGTKKEYNALGDHTRTIEYARKTDSVLSVDTPAVFTESSATAESQDRILGYTYDNMGRLENTLRYNFKYSELVDGNYVERDVARDSDGHVMSTNRYNAFGEIRMVHNAQGDFTGYIYNNLGQIRTIIEPPKDVGRSFDDQTVRLTPTISLSYDTFGNVVKEVRGISQSDTGGARSSITTFYDHDIGGFQIGERKGWDENNIESNVRYKNDVNGRVIEETRDIDVSHGSFAYDHTIKTLYQYDLVGRQKATLQIFDSRVSGQAFDYNGFGDITQERNIWGNASNVYNLNSSIVQRHEYDRAGRRVHTQNSEGYHYYYYDLTNKITRKEVREAADNFSTMRVSESYYDALGRAKFQRMPSYEVTTYNILESGTTQSQATRTPIIQQTYDRWGNAISRTDPWSNFGGNVTYYDYDHNNKVIYEHGPGATVWRADGTSYTGYTDHRVSYDIMGNLVVDKTEVYNADGVQDSKTSYNYYDKAGNLIEEEDATQKSKYYTYDFVGNRVSTRSEMGVVHTFDHNAQGQVTLHNVVRDGSAVTLNTYLYDQAGRRYAEIDAGNDAAYTEYDARGKVKASFNRGAGSTVYDYDHFGQKVQQVEDVSFYQRIWVTENHPNYGETQVPYEQFVSKHVTQNWTYDSDDYANNRLLTFTTARDEVGESGETYTYYYDGFGQLEEERSNISGCNVEYTYHNNGLLESKRENYDGSNYAAVTYTYDIAGRRTSENHAVKQEVTIEEVEYGSTIIEGETYSTGASFNTRYQYDQLGRLTKVGSPAGHILADGATEATREIRQLEYRFDEFGNRRAVVLDYLHPGSSQTSRIAKWYAYDHEGRMVVEGGSTTSGGQIVVGPNSGGKVHTYNNDGQRATTEEWQTTTPANSGSVHEEYELYTHNYNDLGQIYTKHRQVRERAQGSNHLGSITSTSASTLNEEHIYDDRGFKTSFRSGSYITSYEYDDNGNMTDIEQRTLAGQIKSHSYQYRYDRANNLLSFYQQSFSNSTIPDASQRYFYNYDAIYSGYHQVMIQVDPYQSNLDIGTTSNTYDIRGRLIASFITENEQGSSSTTGTTRRNFVYDADGQIIGRHQRLAGTTNDQVQAYYYNDNASLADIGDLGFHITPIDSQHQGGNTPSGYTINAHDSLSSIAQMVYGDAALWYVLADANGITVGPMDILGDDMAGRTLTIPNRTETLHNNATTFKPYNAGEVIGDLTPSPTILPPPKKDCNVIATIIVVIVAIVVTYFTAGAASGVMSSWAAAFVGGVAGSLASQAVGMMLGVNDGISLRQAFAAGISGAITAGIGEAIGSAGALAEGGRYAAIGGAIKGAGAVAAQAIANKIVGLDSNFSWRNVAAGALSGAVNTSLGLSGEGAGIGDIDLGEFGNAFASGFASSAISSVISRAMTKDKQKRQSYGQIALDSFGNALGEGLSAHFDVKGAGERYGESLKEKYGSGGAASALITNNKPNNEQRNDEQQKQKRAEVISNASSETDDAIADAILARVEGTTELRQAPVSERAKSEFEEEVIVTGHRNQDGSVYTTAEFITRGIRHAMSKNLDAQGNTVYVDSRLLSRSTERSAREFDALIDENRAMMITPTFNGYYMGSGNSLGSFAMKKFFEGAYNGISGLNDVVDDMAAFSQDFVENLEYNLDVERIGAYWQDKGNAAVKTAVAFKDDMVAFGKDFIVNGASTDYSGYWEDKGEAFLQSAQDLTAYDVVEKLATFAGETVAVSALTLGAGAVVNTGAKVTKVAASLTGTGISKTVTGLKGVVERLVVSNKQSVRFNSQADPILDSIGDARVSHPEEFKRIMSNLEANNVRVNIDDRSSTIAYDPDGNTIHLPESFSISALRHEVGHFEDHKNLGFPRFIEYFKYPELRVATERRQYLNEIRFAREIGDNNARRTLIQNYLNERKDIVDNYYQRPYGGKYNANPLGDNQ